MALLTAIAAAAFVVSTASYVSSEKARKEAQANYAASAEAQAQARSEQGAINAQQAAAERRQQIREQRVKQARLLQASSSGGTEGSSAESGALGGLATQLGANIGSNLGLIAASGRISDLQQTAADFSTRAQQAQSAQAANQNLFGLATTIFSAAGGFNAFRPAPAPKVS